MRDQGGRITKVEKLADELFRLVEKDQGKGFISDGLGVLKNEDEFFEVVKMHLNYSRIVVKRIESFLRKYGK